MFIQSAGVENVLLAILNRVCAGKYEKVTLLAPPRVTVAPGVANTLVPAVTPVTEPDVAIVLQFGLKPEGTVVVVVEVVTVKYGRYWMTMMPCAPAPPLPFAPAPAPPPPPPP